MPTIPEMKRLLEKGSHERLFSKPPYKIRSRKDERLGFITHAADSSSEAFRPLRSTEHRLSPSEIESRAFEEEIKTANFLLHIENDMDADDFVPYTSETLNRATSFLRRLLIHAHTRRIVGIGAPRIGPADHGSIDLHWDKPDRTLLINFPTTDCLAQYYGRKPGNEISGKFDPTEGSVELAIWLTK